MPEKLVVVSNTGPLLSAFQCGRTDLLRRYLQIIYIPESSVAEFQHHGAGPSIHELLVEGLAVTMPLAVKEVQLAAQIAERIARSSRVSEPGHHLTEAEAIALMSRPALGADLILLEERAARQVAREMGLPITGFIGILLMACWDKVLQPVEMRHLLEMCRRQGTRYSEELIESVCRLCQEVSNL